MLIRVRQELLKRLDRMVPVRGLAGSDEIWPLLTPECARAGREGRSLHAALAAATELRFPSAGLQSRVGSPPDVSAILGEAHAILDNQWTVFGRAAPAFAQSGDWRSDPFDGRRYPFAYWTQVRYMGTGGDVKFVWELNRHHALVRLAQGYHLTGDETFAEAALSQLDSWSVQNPPGRGINWTSSLEVAFRAIAWCWIWRLTYRSESWTEARTSAFIWQLWHHARYMERYDSVHHSPNTHLTGEALGMLYVGTTFPDLRRASHWRAFGTAILDEEIGQQFLADGFHFERAVGYHRYHLEFYLHALLLLRQQPGTAESITARIADRLHDGFASIAALVRPDGSWPVFGDEDGGSTVRLAAAPATDLRPLLTVGAAVFNEPTWLSSNLPASRSLAWWLCDTQCFEELASMSARSPESTSTTLPAAGYVVARDSWSPDAWYCAVDVGPHGGTATGHAHTDLGHVEISRGGARLLADPGSLTYTGDPSHRSWHRSEEAHARPSVVGVALAEPAGPFAWRTIAPTPTYEVADDGQIWQCRLQYSYGADDRSVAHERQVVLVRGSGVIICDWLDVPQATVQWHWPVAASAESLRMEDGRLDVNGLALHWHVIPTSGDQPALEEHSFSRSYATAEPGTVVRIDTAITRRATGVACALDSRAPSPTYEFDGELVRCIVGTERAPITIQFERGRMATASPLPGTDLSVTAPESIEVRS